MFCYITHPTNHSVWKSQIWCFLVILQKKLIFKYFQGLLRGCIAGPVKNFNRQKREHNAHLFAVESPVHDGDSDDIDYTQQISEDQWTTDAKKAKLELEDYEDVD